MSRIAESWRKLRFLLRRRQLDLELAEEMRLHAELKAQKNIGAGMHPDEALMAARRQLGNTTLQQEHSRENWGFMLLESLAQDIRYALRGMRKARAFTCVAIATLAVGIGANTSMFSVINAVILRPLPVRQPDRLVLLTAVSKGWPDKFVDGIEGYSDDLPGGLNSTYSFSEPAYLYLKSHNHVFEHLIAFSVNSEGANVGMDGNAVGASLQAVSGDFFEGLGVAPFAGRNLQPSDDSPSAAAVAVISHDFWQKHLAGQPLAGKTITVNGARVSIVGVLPPEFFGLEQGDRTDIYVPLSVYIAERIRTVPQYGTGETSIHAPKVWWLGLIGRRKDGITQQQVEMEIKLLFDQSLHASLPTLPRDAASPVLVLKSAARGLDNIRKEFSTSFLLLMGMVGLVLLIACANLAGLLLSRAWARQKEIAVRISLGATRKRVIRQLVTESILLGLIGGAAGLFVATWMTSGLVMLITSGRWIEDLSVSLDWRVFLFTGAVAVLSGVLFGLTPALRATQLEVSSALKQQSTSGSRYQFFSGKLMVAAQVALALVLLVSAGLLVRTLQRLESVNLGFDQHRMVTFQVQPGMNGYKGAALWSYYLDLQRRISSIPGVSAAGFSQQNAIGAGWSQGRADIPGYTDPKKRVAVWRHWIGPGYFETMGVPLLLGRYNREQDTATSPRVVVVNQRVVRDYFHGDNPIGRQMDMGTKEKPAPATIIGVVADVKYSEIRKDAPPTAYFPFEQSSFDPLGMTFVVRTAGDPEAVMASIRHEALAQDKNVPVRHLVTETDVVAQTLFLERTFALLSSGFGLLAVLLACIGLYGTMAYVVSRRTNEIGIRIALGAERGAIVRMVVGEMLGVIVAGVAIGMPLAWTGTRLLKSQLFALSPHDPGTTILAVITVVAVTLLAGFLPARRASRVDPLVALRYE